MRFSVIFVTLISVATSVSAVAIEKRDGCHKGNDSIGKPCTFASEDAFMAAAMHYCGLFSFGQSIPQGQSVPIKINYLDDGFGGHQIFWGNYRIDRNGAHQITAAQCQSDMKAIYQKCQGYGGWYNTDYGTVFGECIRM